MLQLLLFIVVYGSIRYLVINQKAWVGKAKGVNDSSTILIF
ncbi:hypothetical protein N478_04865 [Pseudoalteromonas luteoviolacea S4060-1]|uniref:Uncharacterized protein n=1 Tax=Pseudoalteromonas luteoviolacea S4060-1 TaxID=1365257 RepID=A0A167JN86_9GAMM|nr:hypothetical protein N478_04865 [Pseudoalteromonas luteoviolacea S4060-1]